MLLLLAISLEAVYSFMHLPKVGIKRGNQKLGTAIQRKSLAAAVDTFQNVEGISEAFVGGTVGVMSVMMMLELKKKEDLSLESCPYCMGNGEILCAACCGCGNQANAQCRTCGGIGLVTCINCKGDGRITPILLQSRAVRDPEFATDGISIDSP